MMDSIFDNIPYDYGIYDPQVRATTVSSDNSGTTLSITPDLNTLRVQEETVTETINAELQTIKIQ